MEKYKAIIYDIDGTLLDTLKMNMYPLMKIIKEETGEDWTFEQVLKFAAYPGMKVMEELGVKDQEKTYARWVQYVNDYEDGATLFEGFEEVRRNLAGNPEDTLAYIPFLNKYTIGLLRECNNSMDLSRN